MRAKLLAMTTEIPAVLMASGACSVSYTHLDHSDTCSMCGKFCAVRSMNKALAGEYIDIL